MPTEYDTGETCVYCGVVRSVDWMYRATGSWDGDYGSERGKMAKSTWACLRPTTRWLTEDEAQFAARLAKYDKVHPRRK